jgi:hypothetical protein
MGIDSFIQKLERCMEALVTLNVVTAVGAATVDISSDGAQTSNKIALTGGSSKVIWTAIDLVQGDITTVIDPEFQGDAGKELRDFHKSRETQGLEIMRGNISALKELVSLLGTAYQHRNDHPAPAAKV